jgi:hypothetical protein
MIRGVQLQLRANPSYPLCFHPAYQPLSQYPSDEISHLGGNDETSVAHLPTTQGLSGRAATLGSGIPVSFAMGAQYTDDTEHCIKSLRDTSGGES